MPAGETNPMMEFNLLESSHLHAHPIPQRDQEGRRSSISMLTRLPVELLELIFQYSTQDSLKELRLVNKLVNNTCTPFAFERIQLGVFSFSINNLLALSRSSLAKHVRAIEYHVDKLPKWGRSLWLAHIDLRPPFLKWRDDLYGEVDSPARRKAETEYDRLPRRLFASASMDEGYLAYRKLVEEQASFSAAVEGLVFKECLSSLPNLREVIVSRAKPFEGRVDDSPFWQNIKRDIFIGPDAWLYQREDDEEDEREGIFTVVFLEALGYRNEFSGMKPLERLSLELTTSHSPTDLMGFACDPDIARTTDARFQSVLDAIEELKHLTISAPYFPIYFGDGGSRVRDMHHLLGHAKNLRSLQLGYGEAADSRDAEGAYEDLEDVSRLEGHALAPFLSSPDTIYPYLYELELVADVSSRALSEFLLRHQSTLRRLVLRDSIGDDWELVWKTISKSLELDYVYLEGLYQNEQQESDEVAYPVGHFMEGTDVESELNTAMKAYLSRGDGGEIPKEYYDESDEYPWEG